MFCRKKILIKNVKYHFSVVGFFDSRQSDKYHLNLTLLQGPGVKLE